MAARARLRLPRPASAIPGAGGLAVLALLVVAAPASTQTPERVVFPARPDVCGTGDGILLRSSDGSTSFYRRRSHSTDLDRTRSADSPPCETGVVVVELEGAPDDRSGVRVAVTTEARAARPGLQTTRHPDARKAAEWLVSEARVARDPRVGRDLLFAASLADAEVWPLMLELARDRSIPDRTRRAALHWLGREAASAAAPLDALVRDETEDDEVRATAVFALSRLPADRAVPLLIEVVRTVDDRRVRSRALFWLADLDDPRAVALFEEILAGPGRR